MSGPHFTFRQIEDYAARRLPPEQIPAFHEHAGTCPSCREMLLATTIGSGDEHLPEQQAVNFVAGLLGPDEKIHVSRHIEGCPVCASMVADLEEFRLSGQPRRRNLPWLLPLAAALFAVAGGSIWFALRPHAPSIVIAQLRDADGLLRLTRTDVLTDAQLPPGSIDLIAGVMRSGRLPEGAPDLTSGPRETLRSASRASHPAMEIVAPDGVRVLSDRPEFRWAPLGGASSVEVEVFDEDFKQVARSGALHDAVWVPEAPLPRSRLLLWQVTAVRAGVRLTAPAPPEPPARFEIVPEDAARRIAQAQAVKPPSHLLLAILYSQVGLRKEAASEVDAIVSLNPGSALASSLQKR
jgi:hypothetical protein